jgi:hypothetical protein
MVLAQTRFLEGVGRVRRPCPLWVKSRHFATQSPCPLTPRKQTLVECAGMSALCQKQTHALQQSMLGLGQALTLAEKLRNVIIAARWP